MRTSPRCLVPVLFLGMMACVHQRDPLPWSSAPRVLKPRTFVEARTRPCLAAYPENEENDKDVYSVAFAEGRCRCELDHRRCLGTPFEPDDEVIDSQPLKKTGFGLGRFVCSEVSLEQEATFHLRGFSDARGCPLRIPPAGTACHIPVGRNKLECAWLNIDAATVELRCDNAHWTAQPESCGKVP